MSQGRHGRNRSLCRPQEGCWFRNGIEYRIHDFSPIKSRLSFIAKRASFTEIRLSPSLSTFWTTLLTAFAAFYETFKLSSKYPTCPNQTSADSTVRVLFGITVRCLSVKIKFKFEIRTALSADVWSELLGSTVDCGKHRSLVLHRFS